MVVGVVPVVVVTDVSEVFSAVDPYVTDWVAACWIVAGIVEWVVPVVVVGEVPDVVATVVPVVVSSAVPVVSGCVVTGFVVTDVVV